VQGKTALVGTLQQLQQLKGRAGYPIANAYCLAKCPPPTLERLGFYASLLQLLLGCCTCCCLPGKIENQSLLLLVMLSAGADHKV
jgi:hypothetical protein